MISSQSQPKQTPKANRWVDIVGVAVLALLCLKLVYGIDRVMDIAVSDEGRYLAQGTRLLELGFPSPQWAPLYALWYFALSQLPFVQDPVQLYYLSFTLLSISVPILLYVYLRRVFVTPIIALLTSWLYLVSFSNLAVWPYPTKFAALCVVLLLIVTTFLPRGLHYTLLLVVLLVISFVRPEYSPAFVVALAVGVGVVIARTWKQGWPYLKTVLPKGVLIAALATVLIYFMGNPLAGSRNLEAFSQHFSINYTSWSASTASPWVNNDTIMREVFGKVDSVAQAARANPAMFARHLLSNAIHYPASLIEIVFNPPFSSQLGSKFAESLVNMVVAGFALLALAASIVFNARYRRKMKSETESSKKLPVLPALHIAVNSDHIRFVGLLFLFVSISAVASSLLIYPRFHYLQIQGMLLLILGALFISNTVALYRPTEARIGRSALALAAVGITLVLITPNPAFGWILGKPRQSRTDVKNTVTALRKLDVKEPVSFVTFGGSPDFSYDIYLGDNYQKIPSTSKKEAFDGFLNRYSVNMIIWPEQLLDDARYQDDAQFKEFLAHPDRYGFLALPVPQTNGQRRILLKNSLTTGSSVPDMAAMAAQAKGLVDAQKYEEAAQIYRDLVEIDPSDQRSRLGLAESLAKAGRADEAMVEFNAILDEWPNLSWGYIRRGELLEESGDYKRAFADYQHAATLAPDLADPHFRLGFVYMHNGDTQAAIREFQIGLAIDPTRERPRKALETLLTQQ